MRKADGIYRYRRSLLKTPAERVGKGYLYRNLGCTKKEAVDRRSRAHAELEAILRGAEMNAEKSVELVRRGDHRVTIPHLVKEEYGKGPAQRLKVIARDYKLEHALMDLADRLQGHYSKKTLAMLHIAVLSERTSSFGNVLDQYVELKTTRYQATDRRLRVRIAKYKGDLETAIGAYKLHQMSVQSITRKDANA